MDSQPPTSSNFPESESSSSTIQAQLTSLSELLTHLNSIDANETITPPVRINLGQEWWADLSRNQARGFVERKIAALNAMLQSIEAEGESSSRVPNDSQELDRALPLASTTTQGLPIAQNLQQQPLLPEAAAKKVAELTALLEASLNMPGLDGTPGDAGEDHKTDAEGNVLNEEGLPYLDIREELPASSTPIATAKIVDLSKSEEEEEDAYWSEEAVARRAALRQRLFAGEESSDEEEDEEEDQKREGGDDEDRDSSEDEEEEEENSISFGGPQKAKSSIAKGKQKETIAPTPRPAPQGRLLRSTIISSDRPLTPPSQISKPSNTGSTDPPTSPQPSSILKPSTPRRPGSAPNSPSPSKKKSVAFADDPEGELSAISPPKEPVEVSTWKPPTLRSTEAFGGFKRGFLVPPVIAKSVGTGTGPGTGIDIGAASPPTSFSSPDVPSIQLNSSPVLSDSSVMEAKPKKSLFAQRKAQAKAAAEAMENASTAVNSNIIEVGKPESVAYDPTATRSNKSSWDKVNLGGVVEREPPAVVAKPTLPKITVPPKPDPSASTPPSNEDEAEEVHSDSDLSHYSASEDEDPNAFDMSEAMLLRETTLAYHQKRMEMGRKGLGGWTGEIDSEGEETEWDQEYVPEDAGIGGSLPPSSGAVGFMERIVPRSKNGPVLEGADKNGIVSLETVVPGSDLLNSAVKIGKVEDGKLIIPEGDDSDDQADDEAPDATEMDESAKRLREERKKMKMTKEDMLQKLISGDISQLIQEEEQKKADGPRAPRKSDEPPVVRVVEDKKVTERRTSDLSPPNLAVENETTSPAQDPPKKISKFKAAQLAARGQL